MIMSDAAGPSSAANGHSNGITEGEHRHSRASLWLFLTSQPNNRRGSSL
jgi:hypothetical protein